MYSVANPDSVVVITVTPVVTGTLVHLCSEHEVIVTTVVDWSSSVTMEVDNGWTGDKLADELTAASWVMVALTSRVIASRLVRYYRKK